MTRGTLYMGVTLDLPKRVREHKEKCFKGFSARHGLTLLVWYERHDTMARTLSPRLDVETPG